MLRVVCYVIKGEKYEKDFERIEWVQDHCGFGILISKMKSKSKTMNGVVPMYLPSHFIFACTGWDIILISYAL